MKLGELIAVARDLGDDTAAGELWSDEILTIYANEAEREAARRARLIVDTSSAICTHAIIITDVNPLLITDAAVITLSPKIYQVRRVKLASTEMPIKRIHLRDIDDMAPGWIDHASGQPLTYIPDWQTGKLRFYPSFKSNDTVYLHVYRLPLVDMKDPAEDEPEIPESYHMMLVHWMLYRMFMKPDPDTKDKVKSMEHLALFEAEFGKRSSAIDETWIQREQNYDEFDGTF